MSALVPSFLDVTLSLSKLSFTKVRRYTLVDGLNTIPELLVEVFSTDPDIDMADLLGQSAVVMLDEPAVPRFDGIVRRVEQRTLDIAGVSCYALTIVPRLWLTTKRAGHHIFQQRTALDIVADVLEPYGPAMEKAQAVVFQRVLPTHEYRVQCGETDHNFLSRILSEQGLVSWWSPDSTGQRLWVVTDDTVAGSADMEVPFTPPSGALAATGPHVSMATVNARLCPSEVMVRDYDHHKPAFVLEAGSLAADTVKAEEPLRSYSYAVGRFDDEAGGDFLAAHRLEEARSGSRTHRWEASFAMRPGMKIRLHGHPRDDANGDYLVVSAWTEVDVSTRKHLAEVVPAGFAWRPEVRKKPRIHGTQTAFVVGAPGKEIDVDAEGRILVQFRWDPRSNGASRRVRVAMPWMGTDRGFWAVPRVGDEVVIAYLDGDPDEPLVTGSVNNAVAPPATILPKNESQSWWKSKSTPGGEGFNAILMEDLKGSELLALYAERDFLLNTQRRSEMTVGENQLVRVGGSQSVSVGGGQSMGAGNMTVTVQDKYLLNIGTGSVESSGDFGIHVVGGDLSLYASGDRQDGIDGNYNLAAGSIWTTAKSTLQYNAAHVHFYTPDFMVSCSGTILLSTGGSSIEIGPAGIKIKSSADVSINGAFVKVNC